MKKKMSLAGVGPRFAIYSIISSIVLIIIDDLTNPLFNINAIPHIVMLLAGIIFLIIGIPFFIISAKTISKVYGQTNIYTSGVYSACRHPLYSSFIFFIVPGIVLFFESWILLPIPFMMYLIFRILIREEEGYLKDEFGEQYLSYKKEVTLVFPKLWRIKKTSQTFILLALFLIVFSIMSCNSNKTNDTYEFFKNAELQYETQAQEKYILKALNDILNLTEEELKLKRYEDYMGKEFQWNLHELINHHFVPADQNNTFNTKMYKQLRNKRVYDTIQEIIIELESNKQDYNITVGINIRFDVNYDVDIEEQQKLVMFTLLVTNLGDTFPVPVLSNENVYKHAILFINNKEVTNPATMGGLERTREKDVLLKYEGDYFSWGTSVEYLKTEYGNTFTVGWKYLNIYSNISKVNLEDETIK